MSALIQDPAEHLLAAVRRSRSSPTKSDRRDVELIRHRFGLSLPPPFAPVLVLGDDVVVRRAVAVDGPAIAAVKWRSWQVAYRGLLPDAFLDGLEVEPPAGYWTARAMMPPSPRHGLFVAGQPGIVVGVADVAPWREGGLDPEVTSELNVLYLDPLVLRRQIGQALLDAAVEHAVATGSTDLALWVAEGNVGARRFYEAGGWVPDGARERFRLAPDVTLDEVRYRLTPGGRHP